MRKFNCVYSIGFRCGTEMILKEMGLVKFSSIFGSCCVGNIDKLISCLDTRFDVLFNPANLIYVKDVPEFKKLNDEHGSNRTLNKVLDDVNDWHCATIAHHDMSIETVKNHFERSVTRFYKLINHSIPTLFVYTGPSIFLWKCRELIERLKQEKTINFHILFCNFVEKSDTVKRYEDNYMTLYDVDHENKLHEILQDYDLSNLVTIDDIDARRLFII